MLQQVYKKHPKLRRKILKPFMFNVSPNKLSLLALIVAIIASYCFYKGIVLLGGILVLLNGFLDILDGEVAKTFGRKSVLGDFIDHTFDRIADISIFLGITFGGYVPIWLGFSTIVSVLMVSYLGTQAHALSGKRIYGGLLGRADRILLLLLFSLISLLDRNAMYYCIWLIFILSIVTVIQRFWHSYRILKR